MSSLFSGISLSLAALGFLLIVLMIYLIKGKQNKGKSINKMFIFLVVITILCSFLEMLTSYSISRTTEITVFNNFVCRFYTLFMMSWGIVFSLYLFSNIAYNEGKKFKLNIATIIFILLMLGGLAALVFLTPVEYSNGFAGQPYLITGRLSFILTISTIVGLVFSLAIIEIYKNKFKNVYMTPLVIMFVLFILVQLLCISFNIQLFDKVAFYTLVIMILYLTMESQDNKLIDEFNKSREEAVIANKAKTEFLINMSHEIRTPMNTILGFGQSLLSDVNLTEEVARRDIKNISDAASTLNDLIDNILDISKLEAGEVTLNESDYLLENLIFELNSLIPSKITKEELRFTIDINNDIPREYHGDAFKIFKITSYILLNAIEYTNYGEVKLTIDGKELGNSEYELSLLISNTGHAMTNEIFNRGFEDFVNIENASQNNVDTIKLGIIIAKQLIEMLGGTIEFINRKGEGTKYHVKIKQKIVDAEKIGNIFESREGAVSSSRDIKNCAGLKALVVDDSDINLKLASRYLLQYNFSVTTAKSGKECVDLVKMNDYDIIFIDHMMPEMDGVDTVKALVSTGKKMPPIVALTANSFEGIRDDFIKKGFTDYLKKPINFKSLSKIINNIFGKEN